MRNKWTINNNNFMKYLTIIMMTSYLSAECVDDATGAYAAFGGCATVIDVFGMGCDQSFAGTQVSEECPVSCNTCPADCENEGPTSHGCCLTWSGVTYDGMLYINDSGKVFYNTLENIYGFQFNVEGATLNGEDAAYGGDAGSFTLSTNPVKSINGPETTFIESPF